MKSTSTRSRGRPRIALKWSRIISFDDIADYEVEEFNIEDDLLALEEDPLPPPRSFRKVWVPFFNPKEKWKDMEERDLNSNIMKRMTLKMLAEKITTFRRLFVDRAKSALVHQDVGV